MMKFLVQMILINLCLVFQVALVNSGKVLVPEISLIPILVLLMFRWNAPVVAAFLSVGLSFIAASFIDVPLGWSLLAVGFEILLIAFLPSKFLQQGRVVWLCSAFLCVAMWFLPFWIQEVMVDWSAAGVSLSNTDWATLLGQHSIVTAVLLPAIYTTLFAAIGMVLAYGIAALFTTPREEPHLQF